jgi:hypothetical protein
MLRMMINIRFRVKVIVSIIDSVNFRDSLNVMARPRAKIRFRFKVMLC